MILIEFIIVQKERNLYEIILEQLRILFLLIYYFY